MDNKKTIEEIKARIQKSVDFAVGIHAEGFVNAANRRVSKSWKPDYTMSGETYALHMAIPNAFFHVSMVYAILRANGIDVGKMDYLEPLRFVSA